MYIGKYALQIIRRPVKPHLLSYWDPLDVPLDPLGPLGPLGLSRSHAILFSPVQIIRGHIKC